ncbi:MAG: hypothetical protein FJX72_00715 [Armatimonadetes bacterium]|nr:hypothetical protein [Armatimonadota bacterium]
MMRSSLTVLAILLAAAASAQPAKGPKIEPADFKDPGKVAYKFTKGQVETWVSETTTNTKTAVSLAGQEMNIAAKGTIRQLSTLKALDDSVPTKVEFVTDHVKMNMSVDAGMFAADITVDDKKVKATSGDQVLVDSEAGVSNPMIEQFVEGVQHLGKKAIVLITPEGRNGDKVEGDAEAVKHIKALPDQTLLPVFWKQLEGLKVGDTWETESEMRSMQQMELLKPIKIKTTYKVLGGAKVDGVQCVEIEFRSAIKATNLEGTTKQAGQEMKMKIGSMAWDMVGKAYYDPAKNRPIYAVTKGSVEIEAAMEIPNAGETDVKVVVDLNATVTHNAPWK